MPEAKRLVEIRASSKGGSGYLITDRLILTAWHVIRPEGGEGFRERITVRVEERRGRNQKPAEIEEPALVLWPKEDPGEHLDFALLMLEEPCEADPITWAPLTKRLGRNQDGRRRLS